MTDRERPLIPRPSPRSEGRRAGDDASPADPGVGGAGESEGWRRAMPALADSLVQLGYDIERSASGVPPGGSIVARRDHGDRAVVIAIDSGGHVRATITWVVGEWPSRVEIAGVPVRVIDAVSRAVTVTGQMESPDQVAEVIAGLSTIAPWAGAAGSEPPVAGSEPQSTNETRIPY